MIYILMDEQTAIERGVIPQAHYFQTGEGKVIFKKDILTVFTQKGNSVDFEIEELKTQQALNTIDAWI